MARPPKDNDATQNLKPEDRTQEAPKGTKIGLRRKGDVLDDFQRPLATQGGGQGRRPPRAPTATMSIGEASVSSSFDTSSS